MFNVLPLQELLELLQCKGKAIVHKDGTLEAILGNQLLDSLAKGVGRLGVDLKQEEVLAKKIAD